jgi:hypothetical protein
MSASLQTVPLGLCGELMTIARVLPGEGGADLVEVGAERLPGVSGTRTAMPPASSMLGT